MYKRQVYGQSFIVIKKLNYENNPALIIAAVQMYRVPVSYTHLDVYKRQERERERERERESEYRY